MPLRAAFFDVGRTLITEKPSRFQIYADAARQFGVEIEDEEMRRCMLEAHHGLPLELPIEGQSEPAYRYDDPWFSAFIQRIFGEDLGMAPDQVERIERRLFARFEDPRTFEVFRGVHELLADLRERGVVLGVISNWSARLEPVLRGLDLYEPFDFVLCSALERLEKPDVRIFQRALERAGVAAEQAVHVGDHLEKDVQGARKAGIDALLVDNWGVYDRSPHPSHGIREIHAMLLERL